MAIHGKFNIKSKDLLLKERGLQKGGAVQKYIDQEMIRKMKPYTPMQTGNLVRNVTINSVIGSGKLHYSGPYARYLYYGEIYGPNIPIIKEGVLMGFFSPPKKHPTGREMQYSKNPHPLAGKMWFERAKKAHGQQILDGAKKVAGAK